MTQDEIMEMARQAGCPMADMMPMYFTDKQLLSMLEAFAKLVAEKATEEANARANASWTLLCEKMVAFEREDIIQIIKETPFSNWFQADVIETIRARGEMT